MIYQQDIGRGLTNNEVDFNLQQLSLRYTLATGKPMPVILRQNLSRPLTNREADTNFQNLDAALMRLEYGDGPYPVLDQTFVGASFLDPRITHTRPGKSWRTVNGVIREYDVNEPVLTPEGWSLRPAETNLRWPSENFSSGYTRRGTTIEASDIPLPKELGGVGWAIVETTENTAHDTYKNITIDAGKHSMLAVVHPRDLGGRNIVLTPYGSLSLGNDRSFVFSSSGELVGVVGSGPYEPPVMTKLSGGWLQFDCTATCTSGGVSGFYIRMSDGTSGSYPGNGTSKLHLAWSQVNVGDPIPYIPTASGAVTRAADNVDILGSYFTSIWNPADWAVVLDVGQLVSTPLGYLFSLSDGTISNFAGIRINSSGALDFQNTGTGGGGVIGAPAGWPYAGKVGLTQSGGRIRCHVDGTKKLDIAATVPAAISRFSVGKVASQNRLPITSRRLAIFNQGLSEARMNELTS